MSCSWLRSMHTSVASEVEAAFYERTQAAEAARPSEETACTRLQSAWRGRTTRVLIAYWAHHGLIVERITRGHLGRQCARRLRIVRDTKRQRDYFDAFAAPMQLRFRGFHSRKYLHNFYARKAYIDAVLHKGDAIRTQLQHRLDEQVVERTSEQERTGRESVNKLATRLHHLRSTASCAGIYNSPYHIGYHPTAFGVPVEDHLRNAVRRSLALNPPFPPPHPSSRRGRATRGHHTNNRSLTEAAVPPSPGVQVRPVIKRELRSRKLKPVGSLPPIVPRNMHQATYPDLEAEERNAKWIAKTKRMAQEDFVTAT